jgi:hypothetical protein
LEIDIMNRTDYRKYISFVMIMAILAISMSGFCRAGIAASPPCAAEYHIDKYNCDQHDKDSSACPADEHSVPGHCDSNCDCPCHAQLTAQPVQVVCLQPVAPLEFHEPFMSLPEVYLSKFIPPHILV